MSKKGRGKLEVIVRVIVKLPLEQISEIQQVLLQREDLFSTILPIGRKHHLGLALLTFLDTHQLASRLHLQTSLNELAQCCLLRLSHLVEQLHQKRVFLLKLFVLL